MGARVSTDLFPPKPGTSLGPISHSQDRGLLCGGAGIARLGGGSRGEGITGPRGVEARAWHRDGLVFRLGFWKLEEWRQGHKVGLDYTTIFEVRLILRGSTKPATSESSPTLGLPLAVLAAVRGAGSRPDVGNRIEPMSARQRSAVQPARFRAQPGRRNVLPRGSLAPAGRSRPLTAFPRRGLERDLAPPPCAQPGVAEGRAHRVRQCRQVVAQTSPVQRYCVECRRALKGARARDAVDRIRAARRRHSPCGGANG